MNSITLRGNEIFTKDDLFTALRTSATLPSSCGKNLGRCDHRSGARSHCSQRTAAILPTSGRLGGAVFKNAEGFDCEGSSYYFDH